MLTVTDTIHFRDIFFFVEPAKYNMDIIRIDFTTCTHVVKEKTAHIGFLNNKKVERVISGTFSLEAAKPRSHAQLCVLFLSV